MIMRITKKLGDKIDFAPSHVLPLDSNPFADWSSHLFTAARVQYIIVTNTVSLYSMVMYGKGITNDGVFLDRVTSYMSEFIRDDGHEPIFESFMIPCMARIAFSKMLNRSVLGSMNDLISQAKFSLSEGTISPYDVSFRLNSSLFSYLEYSTPREAFLSLATGR
jgi:hypothetical protein